MAKDGHRHANCFVVGCVEQHSSLFLLPSAEWLRTRWLEFIFAGCERSEIPKRLYVCARHFTEDCFENMGPYRAGFAQRLRINHEAVPSLRDPSSKAGEDSSGPFRWSPARRDAACQTDPAQTRSTGTQLSLRTLQPRFRSEGVQAAVSCRDRGVGTSTGDGSTGGRSTGDGSTGDRSTAGRSTGDGSTGDRSTGDRSTGDQSTGDGSTGDGSTGGRSTGDQSTGDQSTAGRSTGDGSTGDGSTGGRSTRDGSTGDGSTGGRSTRDGSTGDGSTGDRSTGDGFTRGRFTVHSMLVKRRSKRARLDQGQDPEQEPSGDCSSTASEESTPNLQV